MLHGYLLLADGFEETEAITTHDVLHRTKQIEVTPVSIMTGKEVKTSAGLRVLADKLLQDIEGEIADFLILPGGKLGVQNLKNDPRVLALVKAYAAADKPVYAICAAPSILGELGLLDGKNYTCFPGFQAGKGHYIDTGAVIDGKQVTGHSMGYTIPFAQAIVKNLLGEQALKDIEPGMMGN